MDIHNLFNHSLVPGHSDCFQLLNINSAILPDSCKDRLLKVGEFEIQWVQNFCLCLQTLTVSKKWENRAYCIKTAPLWNGTVLNYNILHASVLLPDSWGNEVQSKEQEKFSTEQYVEKKKSIILEKQNY